MRLLALGLAAAVILCAGCQATSPRRPGAGAAAVPLESRAIMMNGFYMGKLTTHWRIEADGTGEYWRELPMPGGAPSDRLEKYRGHLPAEQRAALLAAIARFRSGELREPPCRDPVHDAPSLSIRWGAGARDLVGVYLGCMDARSTAYARQVTAIDAIVARSFVRAGPPFAVEAVEATPVY
jgi:hypothetical protein